MCWSGVLTRKCAAAQNLLVACKVNATARRMAYIGAEGRVWGAHVATASVCDTPHSVSSAAGCWRWDGAAGPMLSVRPLQLGQLTGQCLAGGGQGGRAVCMPGRQSGGVGPMQDCRPFLGLPSFSFVFNHRDSPLSRIQFIFSAAVSVYPLRAHRCAPEARRVGRPSDNPRTRH